MHSDSAHLVLCIVRSSNAVDMKHYSVYQIEKFYDRQRSQDNSVSDIQILICILNLDLWLLTQLHLQLMKICIKLVCLIAYGIVSKMLTPYLCSMCSSDWLSWWKANLSTFSSLIIFFWKLAVVSCHSVRHMSDRFAFSHRRWWMACFKS